MPSLGILILSHREPAQLRRLTHRLARSFPTTPVVVHHDFGQAALDVGTFPPRVRFVRPHVATRWGDFSLVAAMLAAMRLMLEDHAPDWITVVSAADYPLHGERRVVADLEASGADVCMQYTHVDPALRTDDPTVYGHAVGRGAHNMRQSIRRYFRRTLHVPLPLPALGGRRPSIALHTSQPWLVRRLSPYRGGFECYAGSNWLSLRREAAAYLLRWQVEHPELERYLRDREAPDESYPHTVLANAPGLRVTDENFRYVDWSRGGSHPKLLSLDDLPALRASRAHFARKFGPDDPVLDALDRLLDAEGAGDALG